MNQFLRFLLIILCLFFNVKAQNTPLSESSGVLKPLRPSLAIVLAIFSIMLSVTFLILAYAKFCHRNQIDQLANNNTNTQNFHGLIRSRSRFSGIDRAVIDSLPFFRFSSLKGSKEGLECAVCLSRFEETEILRLLPKCKHAFHKNCIDQWLENHSSCPLCRYKFDPNKDLKNLSWRYLTEDPNLEIFIQREQDYQSSSRFKLESRRFQENKQELLLDNNKKFLHKFKHKIIVSDVIIKNRWSDVNSSDLLSLNSEMLCFMSSNRFSPSNSCLAMDQNIEKIKEDIERKRFYESKICRVDRNDCSSSSFKEENSSKNINVTEKRSISEITICSRFKELSVKSKCEESVIMPRSSSEKEDKIRRLWLPIARRTVQWFAGGERNLHEIEYKRQTSNV